MTPWNFQQTSRILKNYFLEFLNNKKNLKTISFKFHGVMEELTFFVLLYRFLFLHEKIS